MQKGVIDISSSAALIASSRLGLYGATKAFSDALARNSSYESSSYMVSVRPFGVRTDLSSPVKLRIGMVDPMSVVIPSLKCLGRKNLCRGPWFHQI